MRAVVQLVDEAAVDVEAKTVGKIGRGLVVFLGVTADDTTADADYLADKILHLRIFPDAAGKMNLSLLDCDGQILIISQFTLYGDCRKGRRPGFDQAAPAEFADQLYKYFVTLCRREPIHVATGQFQTEMSVHLTNHGPVTILLDSHKLF